MDFSNLAELFISLVMGRTSLLGDRTQKLSATILDQMRRVLILVLVMIGAFALFCVGMAQLVERILDRLDQGGSVLTPSIGAILIFMLLCLCILLFSTNKRLWLEIQKHEKEQHHEQNGASSSILGTQLESVLSLLVLDFLKERGLKREKTHEKTNDKEASAMPESPTPASPT